MPTPPTPLRPPAWLLAAADAGRVGDALRRLPLAADAGARPGAEPGAVRCELLDLRARGATWKVRYRVDVDREDGTPIELVLVGEVDPAAAGAGRAGALARATGALGTAAWRGWLPALGLTLRPELCDHRLPAAALLLDPPAARELVERALRSAAPPGVRVVACVARRVRYVYGARCTIVFDVEVAGDAGSPAPAVVVAKAHADGAGARVDAVMRALWGTDLARGDVVRIAEPLGYLPDPGVLLQAGVPGDVTVREVLTAAAADPGRAERVLAAVADGLVALHGCGLVDVPGYAGSSSGRPTVPRRTWEEDVARARRTVTRLVPGWPAAAEQLGPALDALEATAMVAAAGVPRPGHGAFRPSQVLVDGDRVGFVDFDGFCLAEPERDLGRFCKALRKAVAAPPAVPPVDPAGADQARANVLADRLVELFLGRYAAGAPMSRERVAAWEALDELAGRAHRAATRRPDVDAGAPAGPGPAQRRVPPSGEVLPPPAVPPGAASVVAPPVVALSVVVPSPGALPVLAAVDAHGRSAPVRA